jgi:hypothetical protein
LTLGQECSVFGNVLLRTFLQSHNEVLWVRWLTKRAGFRQTIPRTCFSHLFYSFLLFFLEDKKVFGSHWP